jgi:hypothetical protein
MTPIPNEDVTKKPLEAGGPIKDVPGKVGDKPVAVPDKSNEKTDPNPLTKPAPFKAAP